MTPKEIKAALMLKGIRQVDLARKLGVTYMAIWMVINGRFVSHRIQKAIAESIDKSIEEIWPKKTA